MFPLFDWIASFFLQCGCCHIFGGYFQRFSLREKQQKVQNDLELNLESSPNSIQEPSHSKLSFIALNLCPNDRKTQSSEDGSFRIVHDANALCLSTDDDPEISVDLESEPMGELELHYPSKYDTTSIEGEVTIRHCM